MKPFFRHLSTVVVWTQYIQCYACRPVHKALSTRVYFSAGRPACSKQICAPVMPSINQPLLIFRTHVSPIRFCAKSRKKPCICSFTMFHSRSQVPNSCGWFRVWLRGYPTQFHHPSMHQHSTLQFIMSNSDYINFYRTLFFDPLVCYIYNLFTRPFGCVL